MIKIAFRFIIWYLLMWVIIFPIGWYFIIIFKANFEYAQYYIPLFEVCFLLALLFRPFREFVLFHLKQPFLIFDSIDRYYKRKKIKKLEMKRYVYIKYNA
jgi:hypothetical protein